MKKITKSHKPKGNKYIFTEGINYFETGKTSIWGTGDKDTLELLRKIKVHGKCLNLAAGDGRYNLNLLEKADFVIASDIDESALSKLWHNTPKKYRKKLDTKVLQQIIFEIDSVLKANGRVIIDFATDIKRISPNGKLIVFGKEPLYSLKDAKKTLKNLFKNYRIQMHESKVVEDFEAANPPYTLNCKFVILIADKKKESAAKEKFEIVASSPQIN